MAAAVHRHAPVPQLASVHLVFTPADVVVAFIDHVVTGVASTQSASPTTPAITRWRAEPTRSALGMNGRVYDKPVRPCWFTDRRPSRQSSPVQSGDWPAGEPPSHLRPAPPQGASTDWILLGF